MPTLARSPLRRTSNKTLRQRGSGSQAPANPGSRRTKPNWYTKVAWSVIAPVWAVGAFFLAVGFLAVPAGLFDGKSLAALRAKATSQRMRIWSRLPATANADTSRETPAEARA